MSLCKEKDKKENRSNDFYIKRWLSLVSIYDVNISPDVDFPFPSNRSSDSQTLGDHQDSLASSLALSCN